MSFNDSYKNNDDEEDFKELPVIGYRSEIMECIRKNQMIICISETGSGKTTQIPQFCLDYKGSKDDDYKGVTGIVAVTQPRRVAAITVAMRVATERHSRIGDEVGYTVRFDDKSSAKTRIKYMTDGILVRECLYDSTLSKYSVIMLDEAHERSMSTDILFGLGN
jgi:HrpA-like RNA helicase